MTSESYKKGQDTGRKRQSVLALFLFWILVVGSIFPVRSANAAAGEHSVGFGFGETLLMGDFAKNFSDSLGFKAMYSYEASDMFGLLMNFTTSSHSNTDGSNTLGIKGIVPDLRVNLAYIDKLVIYMFGGFGLYNVSETLNQVHGSVWTLGFDLGAGFLLNLDKHFAFGTSLGFNNVFGKTDPATVTATSPNGNTIGGTYMGIFLNLFYIF